MLSVVGIGPARLHLPAIMLLAREEIAALRSQ